MIRLLFIVPYPELREKVEHVISHHPEKKRLNADIRVMTVEDTPDFPADEYDAIIARDIRPRRQWPNTSRSPPSDCPYPGMTW